MNRRPQEGQDTHYAACKCFGNLGAVDQGIFSGSVYGVLDDVTFPRLFQIFKPECHLKPGDVYQSKPTIAVELVRQLFAAGFQIKLVLAGALYGESGPFLSSLEELRLSFDIAIREN
jgi:SRSO17 transposase